MSSKTRCESKEAEIDKQFLKVIKPQVDVIEYFLKCRATFVAVPAMGSKQVAEAIGLAERNLQQMVEAQDEQ